MTQGITSAGPWFQKIYALGTNEPQNRDILGFFSWIAEGWIWEIYLVDLLGAAIVKLKKEVPGIKNHRTSLERGKDH